MSPSSAPSSIRPLSQQLWGLELCAKLPHDLGHGIVAVPGNFQRIAAFLGGEFRWMAEKRSAPQRPRLVEAKRFYLAELSDVIEFQRDGECVGAFVASPEDWSTYYVRTFAIAPSAQRRSAIRTFIRECLFEPLRQHGVERLVADTSPNNVSMNRLFGELSFAVTGHNLSERWGPMVRYTLFLDDHAEEDFTRRYGGAVAARPNGSRAEVRSATAELEE
jgi:hypothetical protein